MATSDLLFKDKKEKILKESLLSTIAENKVKSFRKRNDRGFDLKDNPTSTQLRRFYNDVLTLKNKIDHYDKDVKEEKFKQLLPYVKMLKAKVAYSKSRNNVNKEFKKFIDEYVDSINDLDDFYAFCDFFEAIVAYAPLYLKK